jgi:hypothetical protein
MKIFSYCGYFKLPDDFKGGLSEALRAFADYHDSTKRLPKTKRLRKLHSKVYTVSEARAVNTAMRRAWDVFEQALALGARYHGVVSIQTLKGKKWVQNKI